MTTNTSRSPRPPTTAPNRRSDPPAAEWASHRRQSSRATECALRVAFDPTGGRGRTRERRRRPAGGADEPAPAPRHDGAGLLADGGLPDIAQTRQILVAGTGLAGLALAAFLQRSGHDPVLVDTAADRSAVTTVWPPGLTLLDRLGAGAAVRTAGRPLDAVSVRTQAAAPTSERTLSADGDAPVPLVVSTETLRELLADRVSDVTTLSTAIDAVTPRPDALEVEFANGVREYFDLVVGADGPSSTVRAVTDGDPPDWTPLAGLEIPIDEREQDRGAAPLDSWQDSVVAQTLPSPETDERVLRLTAAASARDCVDAPAAARSALPDETADTGAWTKRLSAAEWTHGWQADAERGAWADGRVAYCGAAAFPVPDVTGLRAALALEDAWVLADELARGPEDTADAVAAYGERRRRRVQTVFRRTAAVRGSAAYPEAHAEPLATTSNLRAAALGSLGTGSLAELQRDVPGRL